jgi:GAF domain-containing protein
VGGEPAPLEVELAAVLSEVARTLMAEGDLDATLDRICSLAVETIKACEFAGISIVSGRQVTSRVTTDDVPRRVDELQAETGEGPCADAIREHEVFRTGRLSDEARWPNFASRAHDETGIQSVMSLRLYDAGDTMGALTLYSSEPDAFDDHDVAVGVIFATHAAVAMSNARRAGDLEAKSASRDVIGIAKGMLMAQSGISDDEAFDLLRKASQRMHVKVRDVAGRIASGQPMDQQEPGPDS